MGKGRTLSGGTGLGPLAWGASLRSFRSFMAFGPSYCKANTTSDADQEAAAIG